MLLLNEFIRTMHELVANGLVYQARSVALTRRMPRKNIKKRNIKIQKQGEVVNVDDHEEIVEEKINLQDYEHNNDNIDYFIFYLTICRKSKQS